MDSPVNCVVILTYFVFSTGGNYQGYPPRDNYRPDGYQGYNGNYSGNGGGFKRGNQSRGGSRGGACQLCTALLTQIYYPQYCCGPIYTSLQKLTYNTRKKPQKQLRYQIMN